MNRDWLDYVTAIGSVATPILVLLLTGVGWRIKSRWELSRDRQSRDVERIKELEDKLREDRIEIYFSLLEPFFNLITAENLKKTDSPVNTMNSVDYKRLGFKLSLLGDDSVVRAYNNIFNFYYNSEKSNSSTQELKLKKLKNLDLLTELLLEIRRSIGNKSTELDKWEMLGWLVRDVEVVKQDFHESNVGP